jgi:hypothetical protein
VPRHGADVADEVAADLAADGAARVRVRDAVLSWDAALPEGPVLTAGMMTGAAGIASRLLPRVPARLIMTPGLLVAATGLVLLTRIQVDSSYATHVLPSLLLLGLGMGATFMPAMSTATFGVAPRDAGVASAMVNTSQQVGGSIGIALLNTVATSATASYLTTHGTSQLAMATGVVHGFSVAIWWAVGFLLAAAVVASVLITARPAARVRRGTYSGGSVARASMIGCSSSHHWSTGRRNWVSTRSVMAFIGTVDRAPSVSPTKPHSRLPATI